jgi:hypothetical protein
VRALDDMAVTEILREHRRRCLLAAPDAIVSLLAEHSSIYAGRSTADADRLRGFLLARFEATGLPASALPYVIRELESGLNPHVVAAAAKALRGGREFPGYIVSLLLGAIDRLQGSDDVVYFDFPARPAAKKRPGTALMELFRTLAWLGPRASEAEAPLKAMRGRRPYGFSPEVMAEIEKAVTAISRARPVSGELMPAFSS